MKDDINSLSHSKWNCKYHIVFAPKYRRRVIYGQIKKDIGNILRQLCEFKEVNIIKGEMCSDHVHMLVEIPPKISIASFMGYLKEKSTLRIFDKYANLKYKYGKREFWCIIQFDIVDIFIKTWYYIKYQLHGKIHRFKISCFYRFI